MIKSMTGFARIDYSDDDMRYTLEMRSYNNRYLDMYIQLPSYMSALEPLIREYLTKHIVHGKIELFFKVKELSLPVSVNVDENAARAGAAALKKLANAALIQENISIANLMVIDGILTFERTIDTTLLWNKVLPVLTKCVLDFDTTRINEGKATEIDISKNLTKIENALIIVKQHAGMMESSIKKTLHDKFHEVMGSMIDENRILAETALFLTKYTISEEIMRLETHIQTFKHVMVNENAPGKKLDFISQEMNRETNTIGSKNTVIEIGSSVIEMKDAIEKIREQLRNIE